MKKKLFAIVFTFLSITTLIFSITYYKLSTKSFNEENRNQAVLLNEIQQLANKGYEENNTESITTLNSIINDLQNDLLSNSKDTSIDFIKKTLILLYLVSIIFLFLVFSYIFFAILSPFEKMNIYANELAKGNFNIPLNYERSNYFGAFTWAFDHMRKEIVKARSLEKEAILNNKTVIATLSHDIKTPIASIRAYSEALEAGLNFDIETKHKYISVITRKCDEVTKITNDLFLHSLSDLNKLKMNFEKINIKDVIEDSFRDISETTILKNIPSKELLIDTRRFEQVIENIVTNSKKYSTGILELFCEITSENYIIYIYDLGNGIPPEDLPFVFHKFYRGKNSKNKEGAGLGLFIVKYIVEQHGGNIYLSNSSKGLNIKIEFPLSFNP